MFLLMTVLSSAEAEPLREFDQFGLPLRDATSATRPELSPYVQRESWYTTQPGEAPPGSGGMILGVLGAGVAVAGALLPHLEQNYGPLPFDIYPKEMMVGGAAVSITGILGSIFHRHEAEQNGWVTRARVRRAHMDWLRLTPEDELPAELEYEVVHTLVDPVFGKDVRSKEDVVRKP